MYLSGRQMSDGFTLTEVLIVVAVVAVLAAIAVPSYQDSIRKTRRSEGHSLLLEAAQLQERHFTEFGRYAVTLASPSATPAPTTSNTTMVVDTNSENGYYTLSLPTASASATGFTINAAPQGAQASDSCGTLTLRHTGEKGASGGTVADCW